MPWPCGLGSTDILRWEISSLGGLSQLGGLCPARVKVGPLAVTRCHQPSPRSAVPGDSSMLS